jgi:thiol:disulfide interchange protein DsbG
MNKSLPTRLCAAALLAVTTLHAPAAEWSAGAAQTRAAAPATWDELAHTRWIADGRDDAPLKVYVFMDANCKFCTKFWSDARPWVDSGKVQLRHIMVGVIAPSSDGKAATLLLDPNPARRLASFEGAHAFAVARMMAGGEHHSLEDPKLPPLDPIPPQISRTLQGNERLMTSLGIRGTPGIIARGLDGRLIVRAGLTREDLPSLLGPL